MVFESFDIEYDSTCAYDWVEVSYGSYSEKFCGRSIPSFTSTGQTMTVRFQTDNSVVDLGFSAVWTEVLSQGGVPTQPSSIYSPASSFTNQQGELTLMQIHA